MQFNAGNQILSKGFGSGGMNKMEPPKSEVDETATGFGGIPGPNDMSKNNDTKMSDNEAFMAYMNKAGEEEEDY